MNAWNSNTPTPNTPTGDPPTLQPRRFPLDRAFMALILLLQLVILVFLWRGQRPTETGWLSTAREVMPAVAVVREYPPQARPLDWDAFHDQINRLQADLDRHWQHVLSPPPVGRADVFHHAAGLLPTPPPRRMPDAWANFRAMDDWMRFNDGWTTLMASPTLDMRDMGHQYLVACSLPRSAVGDVRLNLHGRLLTIACDAPPSAGRSAVRFERRLLLPGPVSADAEAEACWTNGILRIAIPKAYPSDRSRADDVHL